MSPLREALVGYLRLRRRLGFEMPQDGRLLQGFVEFLEQAGAERITTELALEWARLPTDAHPHYWRQRMSVVRGFARHLATIDPASEVPSKDLLPGTRQRLAPHTISWIVREACSRAGLPRVGAHRLRHTAATEMLRQGASLAEIGQVLRHREQKTTAIYAKVDRRALRALARPWPSQEGGAA